MKLTPSPRTAAALAFSVLAAVAAPTAASAATGNAHAHARVEASVNADAKLEAARTAALHKIGKVKNQLEASAAKASRKLDDPVAADVRAAVQADIASVLVLKAEAKAAASTADMKVIVNQLRDVKAGTWAAVTAQLVTAGKLADRAATLKADAEAAGDTQAAAAVKAVADKLAAVTAELTAKSAFTWSGLRAESTQLAQASADLDDITISARLTVGLSLP